MVAWGIGLLAYLAIIGIFVSNPFGLSLIGPLFLLSLALFALVAEVCCHFFPSLPVNAPDGCPTDGVVDVVRMALVDGTINPLAPRFLEFRGVIDGVSAENRPTFLPKARPEMIGRVAFISLFIGRDGVGWSDDEIANGLRSLDRAGTWIEKEAMRRQAKVNIDLADTYFRVLDDEPDEVEVSFVPEGDDFSPMEAMASMKAVSQASRAAMLLGFLDVVDLMSSINPRVEADERIWLLHIRRKGRSLALPVGESDIDGVGLAICFSQEASFPESLQGPGRVDPVTIVHEILHLFGASDKYNRPIRSFPSGLVTYSDIMRLEYRRLSDMLIDDLTAIEIGWN